MLSVDKLNSLTLLISHKDATQLSPEELQLARWCQSASHTEESNATFIQIPDGLHIIRESEKVSQGFVIKKDHKVYIRILVII
jgi:hypothetical protein